MISTNSDKKAQVIERHNRTIKNKIGRLFESRNSYRYIDKLQDLVNNYNNTVQSTIKMKPIDAIKRENYDLLLNSCYKKFPNKYNNLKYEVGDVVYLSAFTKEITGKWTRELFKISKITDSIPITNNIVDLNNESNRGHILQRRITKNR